VRIRRIVMTALLVSAVVLPSTSGAAMAASKSPMVTPVPVAASSKSPMATEPTVLSAAAKGHHSTVKTKKSSKTPR